MEYSNGEEKLRKVWRQIIRRCTNPKDDRYYRYGARGISICAEWNDYLTFRSWAMAAGYRPGVSIDRIDNDGNYEPSNCEWSDPVSQANNRSSQVLLTAFGETKSVALWSRDPRCLVSEAALRLRVSRRGWEHERAITSPASRTPGTTHCPQGHEYTEDNITWQGPDKKGRKCRACMRSRAKARYDKKKGSA